MSSDVKRRLAWWQWLIVALAVAAVLTLILTVTLEPGSTDLG
jgi:hypothetical protein